jgi:hypothetical protein
MVAEMKGAQFEVFQFNNGTRELWISYQRHPDFIAPADAATLSLLAEKGIDYKTYAQGRDFGHDMPRPRVALFCISILVVGAGIILWRVAPKTIAVLVALLMIAFSTLLTLITPWHTQSLSAAAARKMIAGHQAARFEVVEYSNGSKELWITPPGSRHYPRFIVPADEDMLALLGENKIAFRTSIQGRDFGYGGPTRGVSLFWISLLTTGAASLLWFGFRKGRKVTASASNT